jgi:hypothetical protein
MSRTKSNRRRAETFPVRIHGGHVLAEIGGKTCLIDTGSPVTVGNRSPFTMLGMRFEVAPKYGPVTIEQIAESVGTGLDYLIGLDVLQEFPWDIDLEEGRITIYEAGLPPEITSGWYEMKCGSFLGGPMLEFVLNGKRLQGFLDTGAPTQYAPSDAYLGPPTGLVDDFFPGIGGFKATHYEVTFEVGNRTIHGSFGKFPDDLPLARWGTWILGLDVLKSGPMGFDLRSGERRIYLSPRS